jgi:hypothetical protein
MTISILKNPSGLSSYYREILKSWGVFSCREIDLGKLRNLDPVRSPVLICPSGSVANADPIIAFAEGGGQVVCVLPEGDLAKAAGLKKEKPKKLPLRLRVTAFQVPGLAGEALPVVGRAINYHADPNVDLLAYLCQPGRYEGESAGIVETRRGQGRLIVFAFDPALAVLHLRQGDPERADFIPQGGDCARPSHMAADLGPYDSEWIPHADLLCQVLVTTVSRYIPFPLPTLWHLPGQSKGILLYSGDEDNADVAWNDDEMAALTRLGLRMSLYIIPSKTKSTGSDVGRYLEHHDVGPHPNLRPFDGRPVAERLNALEEEILLFEKKFGHKARTIRNHCAAWAGYLEPIEILERLGVEMESSYVSGTHQRARVSGFYSGFGAAMPMRFCRPDGQLHDVFQQHLHLSDDMMFSANPYSYRLSAEVFDGIVKRICTDTVNRFHTPVTVNFHPSNWVKFSKPQAHIVFALANEFDLPVWSFDQWLNFWKARDALTLNQVSWNAGKLDMYVSGNTSRNDISLRLPSRYKERILKEVSIDDKPVDIFETNIYGNPTSLVCIPKGEDEHVLSVIFK